jgi:hypothetical protein
LLAGNVGFQAMAKLAPTAEMRRKAVICDGPPLAAETATDESG